jgi:hypothetical protein
MSGNANIRVLSLAILELIAGGIVLLGGAALIYFSVDSLGEALGIIHSTLGIMGISAGFLLWAKTKGSWTLTVLTNLLIIAFSLASELVLSVTSSLPRGPFVDSIVGTVVAVLIAAVVTAFLAKADLKDFLRKG